MFPPKSMRAHAPSDLTIESSAQDNPLLVDVAHLVLEANLNGKIGKLNLVSEKAIPGVWGTHQPLVM
jgi:hypothetical protein